jgi:SAM-dependent methyltransferase
MTKTRKSTAAVQGRLWDARADDWAYVQQHTSSNSWRAVIDDLAPIAGRSVLDVGCGAGGFAELAARAGATVAGVDAAARLIDHAHRLVPGGDFRVGPMEHLPFADASFDVVTGFNAFQYAADPVAAIREAARVMMPGGRLVVMVWGTAAECEAAGYLAAIGRLLPPPPPGAPGPFALSGAGALEPLLGAAGLAPGPRRVVSCPWEYPDEATMLAGLMASGPAARAVEHASVDAVREVLLDACAPYRRPDGSYRMDNAFHHLICRVAPA